ncbi:MAG: hypothetical protein MKZ98_04625, partial [Pseudomonadales bacterium]|nr:hypothetical protein [Pseudomonadales bacterium]
HLQYHRNKYRDHRNSGVFIRDVRKFVYRFGKRDGYRIVFRLDSGDYRIRSIHRGQKHERHRHSYRCLRNDSYND